MSKYDPKMILVVGFFLCLAGAVLPCLMVLRIIQPNFLVSFVSYAASVTGLVLGVVGVAFLTRLRRR